MDQENRALAGWQPACGASFSGKRRDCGFHQMPGGEQADASHSCRQVSLPSRTCWPSDRSLNSSESADSGFRQGERQRPVVIIAHQSKVDQELLAGLVSNNQLTSLSYCVSRTVVACGQSKVDQEDHAHAGWQLASGASIVGERVAFLSASLASVMNLLAG